MKIFQFLPLVGLSVSIVIPDEVVLSSLEIQSRPARQQHQDHKDKSLFNKLPCPHHILDGAKKALHGGVKDVKNALDHALDFIDEARHTPREKFVAGFDVDAWLEDANLDGKDFDDPEDHPPHHGPPPHHKPEHPGRRPHHPPHHHKPNASIYELISGSKYTTKLAKLISEDSELVEILNSTKANFTIFAPTDFAFSKIPKDAPKPPKEFIKKVLLYHISPGLYPAGRLLFSHTVPTLYNETLLGDKPQRLVAKLGLRGVSINYYSKVVAANIPATNGIIHGVNSILIPPPKAWKIISLLPGEFSTLLLGLSKTDLISTLNSTHHTGGTLFAPTNGAFKKLGPKINAFLFSKFGEKYLKALLKYHVVANETLYSNAYYGPQKSEIKVKPEEDVGADAIPFFHFDLPTLLKDKSLAVDVTRFGPIVRFRINGFVRVAVQDGIAKDGVIQVVNNILIPPKKVGGPGMTEEVHYWNGEEMGLDEFKGRLGPYVQDEEMPKLDL